MLFPYRIGEGGGGSNIFSLNISNEKPINKVPALYIASGADSINSDIANKLLKKNSVIALNVPGSMFSVNLNPSGSGTSKVFTKGGTLICYSPTTFQISAGLPWTFTNFVGVMAIPVGWTVTSTSVFYWSE